MHGKAQNVTRPAKTRLQNLDLTGQKFTRFFTRRRGVMGGVVECHRTKWRWGMPIFADSRQTRLR